MIKQPDKLLCKSSIYLPVVCRIDVFHGRLTIFRGQTSGPPVNLIMRRNRTGVSLLLELINGAFPPSPPGFESKRSTTGRGRRHVN